MKELDAGNIPNVKRMSRGMSKKMPSRPRQHASAHAFSKVDPAEILREYQTTRFPGNFYNMKIGTPYSDVELKLDVMSVISLCTDTLMQDRSEDSCSMGVDTGSQLHVVILRPDLKDSHRQHLVHLAVCHAFEELESLMERFPADRCVIDGLPEQHVSRQFAARSSG